MASHLGRSGGPDGRRRCGPAGSTPCVRRMTLVTGRAPRVDRHGGEVYVYRRAGQECAVCPGPRYASRSWRTGTCSGADFISAGHGARNSGDEPERDGTGGHRASRAHRQGVYRHRRRRPGRFGVGLPSEPGWPQHFRGPDYCTWTIWYPAGTVLQRRHHDSSAGVLEPLADGRDGRYRSGIGMLRCPGDGSTFPPPTTWSSRG